MCLENGLVLVVRRRKIKKTWGVRWNIKIKTEKTEYKSLTIEWEYKE